MTSKQLLREAERLGVELVAVGERLEVFPAGRCTPAFRDLVRAHEAEFLAWLGPRRFLSASVRRYFAELGRIGGPRAWAKLDSRARKEKARAAAQARWRAVQGAAGRRP